MDRRVLSLEQQQSLPTSQKSIPRRAVTVVLMQERARRVQMVAVRQLPLRSAHLGGVSTVRNAHVDAPEVGHGRGGGARRVLGRRGGRRRVAVCHQGQYAGTTQLQAHLSTLLDDHQQVRCWARLAVTSQERVGAGGLWSRWRGCSSPSRRQRWTRICCRCSSERCRGAAPAAPSRRSRGTSLLLTWRLLSVVRPLVALPWRLQVPLPLPGRPLCSARAHTGWIAGDRPLAPRHPDKNDRVLVQQLLSASGGGDAIGFQARTCARGRWPCWRRIARPC